MSGFIGIWGNVGVENKAARGGMFEEKGGASDALGRGVGLELVGPLRILLKRVCLTVQIGRECGDRDEPIRDL